MSIYVLISIPITLDISWESIKQALSAASNPVSFFLVEHV